MKRKIINHYIRIIVTTLFTGLATLLSAQSNTDGSMPQYLFPRFSECEVRMKNGQVQSMDMNYNTVTEKMVFIRNEKYYDMINPDMADTVYLNDRKFVPSGKIFYEVLLAGPIDLLVQHKGNLLPAGKPVGYGGTSQVASSNYISNIKLESGQYNLEIPADFIVKADPVFWIRKNDEMISFMNEKQFIKIFPENTVKIKGFIKEYRIKTDRYEDLIQLVKYCGGLN